MNDKERILLVLLDEMSLTQLLCLRGNEEAKFKDETRGEYVHFGAYDDREVQKDDLVLCATGNVHDWKIGWVHEVIDMSTCIIREIGSNRLCNVSNEMFKRIVGVGDSLLLEGEKYIFQQKVMRAFGKGDEYMYRFGGIDFLDDQTVARVWIREAFGGIDKPSKPFSFEMAWNKRTSVKKILEAMRENGYGTRKFEIIEVKNGQS